MTLRLAVISASAAAESVTAAPPLATAAMSAKLTGPVPTMTVFMLTMVGPRPGCSPPALPPAARRGGPPRAGRVAATGARDTLPARPEQRQRAPQTGRTPQPALAEK